MPFTFSHPAIILPLTYLPKRWFSYWGDGETDHSKVPPYTVRFVLLVFVIILLYELLKYLYYLIIH
ncbi:DUF4184 family protein [Flavobacterium sp. CBA20B-1]|uniref:DUF4184 family protein n=1 Tax=unclassified Flavobacterium TaxID=196869 RepID=UPI0022240C22|nr:MULTISPECIES: DUF4184 family protein [unclassified Flavobacterium]WCM42921.1 DUF4184 family protein [Flavobacterium sp. CBA20B-1]